MENLRDSIIDYMKDHGENEDLFLRDLERIVDKEGDLVFPVLLNVFTQLDFNKSEAKEIWDGIIKRRLEMNEAIGRQVNLLRILQGILHGVPAIAHSGSGIERYRRRRRPPLGRIEKPGTAGFFECHWQQADTRRGGCLEEFPESHWPENSGAENGATL